MFTGIIQDTGRVRTVDRGNGGISIILESELANEMAIGGSISVNGVCLTAVSVNGESVTVEVVPESLSRTALGDINSGDRVNLELPMTAGSLFDGHIVQGHIDGVGRVISTVTEGGSVRMGVEASEAILRYLVEKGSITVDGISLTVASLSDTGFEVAVIPHTLDVTTLGLRTVGNRVNLEVDVLAKYVERLLKN